MKGPLLIGSCFAALFLTLAEDEVVMPSPSPALDYKPIDVFSRIGVPVEQIQLPIEHVITICDLLPPGWLITNIPGHDAISGGLLCIPGKAPGQEFRMGQYPWGWEFRGVCGEEPWANIAEWRVREFFSIAPSDDNMHPALGVRDRKDQADVSIVMNTDTRWGEIRVGNAEGDYPDYYYHFQSGLRFIVDSGHEYISALNISSNANVGIGLDEPRAKLDVDGEVRAQQYQSSDGSAGITTTVVIGGTRCVFKDGLLISVDETQSH